MPTKVLLLSTLTCLLLVSSTSISHALLLFFLAGVIPGTDIVLNPGAMLLLLTCIGCVSLIAIVTAKTTHAKTFRKTFTTFSSKHLPIRRFSNL